MGLNPNSYPMNEERQVMSRPNAARAQGDGLGRAADSGLMNGVSEPTPPVNSMNMDGETVPRVTSLSGTGVASGQDTSSAPPGPSSVDVAPTAVTATGTSSANSARGFLMGPDSRNSVEESLYHHLLLRRQECAGDHRHSCRE